MKRVILFFFFLLLIKANISVSQSGLSDAIVTGTSVGHSVTFIDPHTNQSRNVNAKLFLGTVDGNVTKFYCVDITRTISFPDSCHHDSAISSSQIVYILNNYYPYNPNPVGKLSNLDKEVAATQVALWHYSDGVDANTVSNDNTIKNRALDIIADADANAGSTTVATTMEILPSMDPDAFYVRTLDQNSNPMAISGIQLSISQGALSADSVDTSLPTGESPDVYVSGTSTGTIYAEAQALIPQGITYTCPGSQRLVLALPVIGTLRVEEDWGALPVELASFNANVSGRNVILNWTTSSESNNAGFDIERRSAEGIEWTKVGNVAGNGTSTLLHDYSFTDRNVLTGKYNYRLKQTDYNGNYEYHNLTSEINVGTPNSFSLKQNYPNPFNPTTKIDFDIAVDGNVKLTVYNSSGKEIATLVNEFKTSGYHSVTFDARNISSGIYYYKLESNGVSKVMKMTLLK
ncbi:MAG: Cys-Gln thioester bond-forming surface protein [Ignavibacteriae bacterium]|nr:Cys-Gln thioester bond-forming surface protein [Ignavibacteriota bacterium]